MKASLRVLLIVIAVVCPIAAGEASLGAALRTRHVVILVIDGPRWTETWGDAKRTHIPRMAGLAAQGVVAMDFANDGPTYTNAGHAAITTGVYQQINNNGLELPRHAGIFQRHLARSGAPATDAWVISSKDKLQILTDTTDAAWRGRWLPSHDCGKDGKGVGSGYRKDPATRARTLEILAKHHPRVVLINLREPDSSGHANQWDAYLQGIRDGDTFAAELWSFIQSDPIYRDTTALFVTNDHGRHPDGHLDGFVNHGDDCAGCRRISLLALGPDFRRGVETTRHRGQIDLAVTAAALLGIDLPGSPGQVICELFADEVASLLPPPSPRAP